MVFNLSLFENCNCNITRWLCCPRNQKEKKQIEKLERRFTIKKIRMKEVNPFENVEDLQLHLLVSPSNTIISFFKHDMTAPHLLTNKSIASLEPLVGKRFTHLLYKVLKDIKNSREVLNYIIQYENYEYLLHVVPVIVMDKPVCNIIVQKLFIYIEEDTEENIF